MSRQLLIGAILALWGCPLMAQSLEDKQVTAHHFFENGNYREAASYYEELSTMYPNNAEFLFRRASSLFKALKYNEAEAAFHDLIVQNSQYDALGYYYLGLLLRIKTQYSEAGEMFNMSLALSPAEDDTLATLISAAQVGTDVSYQEQLLDRKFIVQSIEVNSDFHDYGAVIEPSTGSIMFATAKRQEKNQFVDPVYGGFLPKRVRYEQRQEGWYLLAGNDGFVELNTRWSEGSGCFTKDGQQFYFTSCRPENGGNCSIYFSQKLNNSWTTPVAMPETINATGKRNQHPAVSAQGDTLFFASDRDGGQGGMDIWMTFRAPGGQWISAINMGPTINTAGNEITPFWSSKFKALIFSSDGHSGLGGYDNFLAKGISFYSPRLFNLGAPINSSADDSYFYINDSTGFVSSNRSDFDDFDIYQFEVGTEVGFLSFMIGENSLYDPRLAGAKYRQMRSLDLEIFRAEDYLGGYVNHQGHAQTAQTQVISDSLESVTLSDEHGDFGFPLLIDTLSNINASYRFMSKSGIVDHTLKDTTGQYFTNFYENLYFDSGSDDLRVESRLSLDEILSHFSATDIAVIEITTHTDDQGDYDFNFQLSERRGIAVKKYLRELGFRETRIRVIAKGEKAPQSDNTSWYGRLFNRRAEVNIITKSPSFYERPKTYIVRKDVSGKDVAENLGVSIEDITNWNGQSGIFRKGQVIRAFSNGIEQVPNIQYLIEEQDIDNNLFPYTVEPGESIAKISRKFGVPEELILEINHLTGDVPPGTEIIIYQ